MKKNFFYLFLIFVSVVITFYKSFSIYFFQDDFFILFISNINNLSKFLQFFIPRTDVQFFRPLSHEVYFFTVRLLFGTNPLAFHFVGWISFALSLVLVFKLSSFYLKQKSSRFFLVLLYGTSAVHYNSLFWIVNFSYLSGTFFYLLSFYTFKIDIKGSNLYTLSLFFIGLLVSEFLITLPVIILIDYLVAEKKRQKINKLIIGLIAICFFYFIFRFFIFRPDIGTYKMIFNLQVISSFRFFFMYFFNFPETIKDNLITFYKFRPEFLKTFAFEIVICILNFLVVSFFLLIYPVFKFLKTKKLLFILQKNYKTLLFCFLWVITSLLPIIFIPSHISPHHGSITLFGFIMFFIFTSEIAKINQKIFFPLIFSVWLASSITIVNLNNKIHWIYRRSNISKKWIARLKNDYPVIPRESTIYLPSTDKETIVALNDGKAINVLYNDYSLKVLFQKDKNNKIYVK